MNEIEKLLREVNWIIKNNKLEVAKNDDTFNMFRICGVNHYENTHSSIIAEILDPNGSHQLGHKFFEAFILLLIRLELLPPEYTFAYHDITVHREYATTFGRLDIMITNSDGDAILIENKIYAGEQDKQLLRYYTFGTNKFRNRFKLIYLTLFGDDSCQEGLSKSDYLQVSYQDIIIQWLERCIEIAVRSPIVRETLIQYSNHLKNLTNQNTNSTMDKALIDQLSQPENLDAVFVISENISNVQNEIINTIFFKQLEELGEELNIDLLSERGDYVNTSWAGFHFSVPTWKNYKIFTEFSARGLKNFIIGIAPKNDQVDTTALVEIKNRLGGGNARLGYYKFPKYQSWKSDAMKAIITGEMKSILKREIENLLELMVDVKQI
ncbi:PDDEXK-like family protein [Chryseobacterium gregarium]|uniref:PDDEXK-like family protein n=1 Tax=Chryseobacterium gregarium TaxID=456299 RepID=UPI000405AD1E|nr:PD-(D/E)XK nuclease family protein [Chryseobacterium gregarium]